MARTSIGSEGRVKIPKEVRDRLQLEEGAEFEVELEGNTVKLHYECPEIQRVRADRDWGAEAFLDAGDALFGGAQTEDSQIDVTIPSDPVDAISGMLSDIDANSVSLQEFKLADLEGVEGDDDGRPRAKMAKNANGGRPDEDEE